MEPPSTALARPVWWQVNGALVRRKILAITPQFEFFDASGALILYCRQKLFTLKEDIRVYGDAGQKHQIMVIKARQIIDFSAAYDVYDTQQHMKVGALRRRGWKSLVRDTWEILDPNDEVLGRVEETGNALLRRFLNFIPQTFTLTARGTTVATVRHSWNPFVFKAWVDFSLDPERRLDRRLGMAAVLLLMAIEGAQGN